jgi:putative glycosyltransferase (TIGR04372 family)
MKEPLRSPESGIIDYAFLSDKSDLLDIWLFANCTFCVSTGTGIETASFVYNRPVLTINILPFYGAWFTSPVTIIPKKLYWKDTGKALTFMEHLEQVYFRKNEYEQAGIAIKDQSKVEILEDLKDFFERKIEKSKSESENDSAIQKIAWEAIKASSGYLSYHRWVHPECEMGPRWLERQKTGFLLKL